MATSKEMAQFAFGDPGFFDFLRPLTKFVTKAIPGVIKSIPIVGGLVGAAIDTVADELGGAAQDFSEDMDAENYEDEGDFSDEDEEF